MDLDSATTTPTAPTKPEPSLVRMRTLAASTALALAVGFGAGWASHTTSASTGTTAVHGMLQLPDGGYTSVGNVCSGSSGFQDISAGVAVTIGNQDGKTLAVTSLQPGTFGGGGCQFAFSTKVASATTGFNMTLSGS